MVCNFEQLCCVLYYVQLKSLKTNVRLMHLTVERDCMMLQDEPQTNNNNSSAEMASAAGDSCCDLAELSLNYQADDTTRSPSPSVNKNMKRRSTVTKGYVTLCVATTC